MKIKFAGTPVELKDRELKVGDQLPDFQLADGKLENKSLKDFPGKKLILTFPSVDTEVCAMELARFNREVEKLEGFTTLAVSMDLPFAQSRWCQAKTVKNLVALSDFRDHSFGHHYGVYVEGIGLLARAVFVADAENRVVYAQYCDDVTHEPDYEAALKAAKAL